MNIPSKPPSAFPQAARSGLFSQRRSVRWQPFPTAPRPDCIHLAGAPFELPLLPPVSGNWTVMIGAEGQYTPDFEGANHSLFSPVPIFSIRRAGSVNQFRSPHDNASIALIDFGDLRAGAVGKFVPSRKENSYSELNGLGDVKAAFEFGGFIEYFPVDWFRVRNETREGFGGHQGVVSDFSADFIVPVTRAITVSAGPRFTWESTKAVALFRHRRRSSHRLRASHIRRQGWCPFGRRRRTGAVSDQSAMGSAFLCRIRADSRRRGKQPAGDRARVGEPDDGRHRRVISLRHQDL